MDIDPPPPPPSPPPAASDDTEPSTGTIPEPHVENDAPAGAPEDQRGGDDKGLGEV